ncbi:hypothetical protein PHMEG_00019435 [Phytophthora megakarya]|uniref:Uncharacterized protein n=1 Tax=Phytophthora megakarya TaxID=4795 RepID=A0A225VRC5_9STRA|nr:hypothetical protein PHMEG_00019435 [Phytophthora megakarya]
MDNVADELKRRVSSRMILALIHFEKVLQRLQFLVPRHVRRQRQCWRYARRKNGDWTTGGFTYIRVSPPRTLNVGTTW